MPYIVSCEKCGYMMKIGASSKTKECKCGNTIENKNYVKEIVYMVCNLDGSKIGHKKLGSWSDFQPTKTK